MDSMRKRKEKESSIEGRVCRWANGQGIKHRKMNGLGNVSWPDRLFLLPNGIAAFIELKRPGEEPTPLQYDCMQELLDRKQYVAWFDDSDAAISWLSELMKLRRKFGKALAR
jgi:hypothetical protein